ncbi:MAG TPA: pyrroline-5-carboxylate reductase [Xanthobacteraceae bacterium]|nr:pyrroline-5-carboxylate reductase [Xanthobacteraceae bacterium]
MSAASKDLRDLPGQFVLVGAGKMGGALLEGWLRLGLAPAQIAVIEPKPSPEIAALANRGVRLNPDPRALTGAAAIVIAVKPQIAAEALPVIAPMIGKFTMVVSIMAGRTLQSLATALPGSSAIVRAMPNLPASIGRGIAVAVPWRTDDAQRALADRLLSATGKVAWVDDETLLDAVTAVSGSGPAYVFLLAEALTDAGAAAGLPRALAAELARETVAGAGALLHDSPLDAADLRAAVTSPGGTTAAALDVLMGADGLPQLLKKAVAAATARSRKLAE